jgi:hypothetical protein
MELSFAGSQPADGARRADAVVAGALSAVLVATAVGRLVAQMFRSADAPSTRTAEAGVDATLRRLNLSKLLRRLAHEDGLGTTERAAAAIAEYKIFLKLVWLHPCESLMPSKAVDLVWQRHLLDTKAYAEECLELFGAHLHRVYGVEAPDAALEMTLQLYRTTSGGAVESDVAALWQGVAIVPATTSVAVNLSPRKLEQVVVPRVAVEDEDLAWLGVAVAKELPLKQAVCKYSEPLRKIAISDPSATVIEYKKFVRMMVDDQSTWFTPSKLVDELWHRHMLDSVAYCEFCDRVAGAYLHHTPHYGEPHSFHDPGFTATLKACECCLPFLARCCVYCGQEIFAVQTIQNPDDMLTLRRCLKCPLLPSVQTVISSAKSQERESGALSASLAAAAAAALLAAFLAAAAVLRDSPMALAPGISFSPASSKVLLSIVQFSRPPSLVTTVLKRDLEGDSHLHMRTTVTMPVVMLGIHSIVKGAH